ncbi:chymotrypsin inhibitor-like [Lucilia sericata]|uniref:chymotrypsin inhibitor-like n=1 Tax=Lucilia sericata TaxID=13632 RepID=UPI0018A80771|nr:chymotrypsin inhibitor-like [Lucilia sericata]
MPKFLNIFLVFVVVLVFAAAVQAQHCGPNQEFYPCGSACPSRCGEFGMKACTANCVVGCQCKRGYMLNAKNECVPPEEC